VRQAIASPPDDTGITTAQMRAHLELFSQVPGYPYVHGKPIAFNKKKHLNDWIKNLPDEEDHKLLGTFDDFWRSQKSKTAALALCCVPMYPNYIKERATAVKKERAKEHRHQRAFALENDLPPPDPDTPYWHCYAIAAIRGEKGTKRYPEKHLLIYDCDAVNWTPRLRPNNTRQKELVRYIRGNGNNKSINIWYNTDYSHKGQQKCVVLSLGKLAEWAAEGDVPFRGASDPRAKNMSLLAK